MKKYIVLLSVIFYFNASKAQNTFVVGADTLTDRVVATTCMCPGS